MKKLTGIILALLFLAPVVQADGLVGNDVYNYLLLRYHYQKAIETSQRNASLSDSERADKKEKKDIKKRQSCIGSFDISKSSWKKHQEREGKNQDVISMKSKFTTSEITNSPIHPNYSLTRYGDDQVYIRGLANKRFTDVAWTKLMSIPHTRPGCNAFWTVASVQIVAWKDKTCRRVEFQFEERSYHTMMCGEDNSIYLDYSDDLSENMLVKNEWTCGQQN